MDIVGAVQRHFDTHQTGLEYPQLLIDEQNFTKDLALAQPDQNPLLTENPTHDAAFRAWTMQASAPDSRISSHVDNITGDAVKTCTSSVF